MTGNTTIQAAYAGRRVTAKNKIGYLYQFDGEEGPRLYGDRLHTIGSIGSRFELTLNEAGSVYTGGEHQPKVVGTTDVPALVAEWQAADIAAWQMLTALTVEKRLAKEQEQPVDAALTVLRGAMSKLRTVPERAAFANYVNGALFDKPVIRR